MRAIENERLRVERIKAEKARIKALESVEMKAALDEMRRQLGLKIQKERELEEEKRKAFMEANKKQAEKLKQKKLQEQKIKEAREQELYFY